MKVAPGGKPAKLRLHSAACTDQVEKTSARRAATVFGPVEVLRIRVGIQDAPLGNCELIRAHFQASVGLPRLEMQGGNKLYVQMILEL
jgi:hypothetical protein